MFGLMGLFGAACILWGAGAYLRLFLRRPRYDDPLAHAQALSLSRTLDRRLEASSLRQVVWLKFYANMLLPFWGIAGGLLLGYAVLSGAAPSLGAAVWMAAGGCALANLLFLRFYDRLSFWVNAAACLAQAAACFFAPPGGLFPRPPLWAAAAAAALCACNLAYFWRRRALFSPAAGEPGEWDGALPAGEPEALTIPEAAAFFREVPDGAPPGTPVRKSPATAARTEEEPAPSASPAARLDWLLDRGAAPISGAAPTPDDLPRAQRILLRTRTNRREAPAPARAAFRTVRCGAGASARCGARPRPTRRVPRPSRGPGGAPAWGARARRARRG